MADEFPDPDEEFDIIHQADYEALREFEAEFNERPLSQPDPGDASQAASKNKYRIETSSAVTCNKVTSNSVFDIKHTNGEVHGNSTVNNSKKRNYESVFGDSTPSCGKRQSSQSSYIDSLPSTSETRTYETLYDNNTSSCSKTQSSSERSHADSTSSKTRICEALFGDSSCKTLNSQNLSGVSSTQKKRSYEELLADISAVLNKNVLDDVDLVEEPRDKKLRWSEPKDVIEAIINARQLLLNEHNENTSVKTNYNDNKKNSISLRVPPWNFVAVTRSYDSQRLYIRVRNMKNNVKESIKKPIANLLSVPYKQLKAQAEEIMTRKNTVLEQPVSNLNDKVNDELWVDKYRPQSYLELLSDETVNRQLLHWLKLWDKIVFNRTVVQPKKKQQSLFGRKKNVDDEADIEEVDSKGYPIKRIVLLSGPPGLGKTTLAHIAAKHAGYNVVEVNASDERTPDAFRQILLASTEMKSVMGADPRPNCLIFDEIDGAPIASIELLLKFVHGKLIPKTKKGKKQTEKTSDGCARPVVCICNEPYAPTLRTLRAAAVIIPVPEVSPLRLAERLMDIARKEKLNVDFNDLVKIAERSGCDVRACVGALQYMGSTNLKDNLSLGLKDTRKNLFDLWKNILTVPVNAGGVVPIPERVRNILKTVQNGETEKLVQGIFHNYPEIYENRKIDNVSVSLEWFQLYDLIMSLVMRKQIWSLMPYTNYGFIAWHLHLARTQKVKLSYPAVINEVTQKAAKNAGIITAVRRVCGRDAFTLTTDIACFLPDLLTPRLRTVPSHLYSPREKADLSRILNLMLEFGLSFVQEKNFQGGYIYNLDPNIVEIGVLPDCNAHRHLPYAVQQIIAQELEVERLKRASMLTGLGAPLENTTNSEKSKAAENTKNNKSPNANSETTEKQSDKDKARKHSSLKETVYKDFFGNIITKQRENAQNQNRISPKSQRNSVIQNILTKHGVWYKYKEGCNNAVRRKVFMEKLM